MSNGRLRILDSGKAGRATGEPAAVPAARTAGRPFRQPELRKSAVALEGDALVMEFQAAGARLELEPRDGDIFTAGLMPPGRFAAVVEAFGPTPNGFVQFQMDKDGKLNVLRLNVDHGQAYDFRRE